MELQSSYLVGGNYLSASGMIATVMVEVDTSAARLRHTLHLVLAFCYQPE